MNTPTLQQNIEQWKLSNGLLEMWLERLEESKDEKKEKQLKWDIDNELNNLYDISFNIVGKFLTEKDMLNKHYNLTLYVNSKIIQEDLNKNQTITLADKIVKELGNV